MSLECISKLRFSRRRDPSSTTDNQDFKTIDAMNRLSPKDCKSAGFLKPEKGAGRRWRRHGHEARDERVSGRGV